MNGHSYQILLALYWIIISFLTCILVPGTICSLALIPMPDPRRLNIFLPHLLNLVVRLVIFLSLSLTLSFSLSFVLFLVLSFTGSLTEDSFTFVYLFFRFELHIESVRDSVCVCKDMNNSTAEFLLLTPHSSTLHLMIHPFLIFLISYIFLSLSFLLSLSSPSIFSLPISFLDPLISLGFWTGHTLVLVRPTMKLQLVQRAMMLETKTKRNSNGCTALCEFDFRIRGSKSIAKIRANVPSGHFNLRRICCYTSSPSSPQFQEESKSYSYWSSSFK